MPFLTVCMPTYKRLGYLRTVLEGLLPQAEALGVRVLVNDNCSGDGTAEYLASLARRYSCLSFCVNQQTVPIDDNMFLSMQSAEGEFVYPLGDDDFLPEGALAAIVSELASQPDLLILSARFGDAKLNPRRDLLPETPKGSVCDDPRAAFPALWDKMPFGSFVMRREFVNPDDFDKYAGTCHAYSGIVWEKLSEKVAGGKKVLIRCMESPTVILRGGEKSWKDYKARIYLLDIPVWLNLLPPLYAETVEAIKVEYLSSHGSLLSLLAFRRSGQLTRDNCGEYLAYFSADVQRKGLVVSHLPPFLATVLRFLIKTCSRIPLSFGLHLS